MNLPKIKYPKLLLVVLTFVLAYLLLKGKEFLVFRGFLESLGFIGTFFAGILFVYGFTAAFGTAALIILAKNQGIVFAGLVAGFGAMVGDLLIFKFLRYTLADEIDLLSKEKVFPKFDGELSTKLKKYLFPLFGGLIIASPLPDEIGVSLLAMSYNISTRNFIIMSYILNTAGIFLILFLGKIL